MNFFEKSKILTIAILGLLILNFATLALLIFHRPHVQFPMEHSGFKNHGFIEKELNMTDVQKTEFNKLREEHKAAVMQIQDSIKSLKDRLLEQLKSNSPDTMLVNRIAGAIGENQKRLELATFYHFDKVRKLFNDEQREKFDKITKDMMKMMDMHPHDGHEPMHPDIPPIPPR